MKSLQINSIYENIDKEVKKKSNFFISDWNLDIDDTYISNIINESFINGEKNVYNYFSADEDFEYLKQKEILIKKNPMNDYKNSDFQSI